MNDIFSDLDLSTLSIFSRYVYFICFRLTQKLMSEVLSRVIAEKDVRKLPELMKRRWNKCANKGIGEEQKIRVMHWNILAQGRLL